jgi:hypothetical protein
MCIFFIAIVFFIYQLHAICLLKGGIGYFGGVSRQSVKYSEAYFFDFSQKSKIKPLPGVFLLSEAAKHRTKN